MSVRSALNELLAAPAFQALEDQIRRISAFQILGIERRELSHAALLAWVLDPLAGHGMGSAPLRRLLLIATNLAPDDSMLDATDVDDLDLDTVRIETEIAITVPGNNRSRRLDILVSLPGEPAQPLLIVEYKVDALESGDQTANYALWAADQAFELGDRCVLPLQVFLCPDRGEGNDPAPPFVRVDYDAYVEWLDVVIGLDKTAQADFLLRDFRACLAQRADVTNDEQDTLVARLSREHEAAIAEIRRASAQDLAAYASTLTRHDAAFSLLGIIRKRRSKGDSPFSDSLRDALRHRLDQRLWRIGGRGSMAAIYLPMIAKIQEHLGKDALSPSSSLRVHFVSERPKNQRVRPVLEVIGNLPGLDARANKDLRNRLADSLRSHAPSVLMAHPGRGAIVFGLPIDVPGVHGIDDDTEERADAMRSEIELLAGRAQLIEPVLAEWIETALLALLPEE